MKNYIVCLFIGLCTIMALFSCSDIENSEEIEATTAEIENRSRACYEDFHCRDFDLPGTEFTCDLDLTTFSFINQDPNAIALLLEFYDVPSSYFTYDPSLGAMDPNVRIESNTGLITGVNRLVIPCGETLHYDLWNVYNSYKSRRCNFTVICDEECCIPEDCCEDLTLNFDKVSAPNKNCCQYEVSATNNSECDATLCYSDNLLMKCEDVVAGSNVTINLTYCPNNQNIPAAVILRDEDQNICYSNPNIDCTCCSLVTYVVEQRPANNDDKEFCFYSTTITNHSDCPVLVNNKLGQLVVRIEGGETRTTIQRTPIGVDLDYPIYTEQADGSLVLCETITLSGDCE